MEAMYLESLYEGDPMHETMGLSGTDCLWILGKPYSLGGLGPSRPLSSYVTPVTCCCGFRTALLGILLESTLFSS